MTQENGERYKRGIHIEQKKKDQGLIIYYKREIKKKIYNYI